MILTLGQFNNWKQEGLTEKQIILEAKKLDLVIPPFIKERLFSANDNNKPKHKYPHAGFRPNKRVAEFLGRFTHNKSSFLNEIVEFYMNNNDISCNNEGVKDAI